MTSDRWRRVTDLYEAVLEKAPPDREVFLRESCADDSRLRDEVESLLSQERHDSPLDRPIWVSDTLANERPALAAGTVIGSYHIVGLLGEGGMGQVYRAQDTKLPREVALKILPGAFVHDPDRLARFRQEAHVLASLNHPNIATIHGFEDSGAVHALVLELVEGPTLADRIARGPLPLDEALPLAKQIAEALEAAHEQRIIHRDLKPANIKVRPDGTIKVLDFGLAKLAEATQTTAAGTTQWPLSMSPTITSPAMTGVGVLLGTAAYMSPEQAKGRPVDKRSDIWAFGCVLYEMLTGKRVFDGEDVADTLANVLKAQPEWDQLPATTPASIRRLLRRCLEKNPTQRQADIADARFELEEAVTEPTPALTPEIPRWRRIAAMATLLFLAGGALGYFGHARNDNNAASAPQTTRLSFTRPAGTSFTNTGRPMLAISPDGRNIVFTSNERLYIRRLDASDAAPIPGTENLSPTTPVFSPDGRWIAFHGLDSPRGLKKIPIDGGVPITIAPTVEPLFGVSWSTDDSILLAKADGVFRVAAGGGALAKIFAPRPREVVHGPQMLPDGDHILLTATNHTGADRWDKAQLIAYSISSGARVVLIDGGADGRYLSTGHIVYAVGPTLFAVPFDATSLRVTGAPVAVLKGVRRATPAGVNTAAAHVAMSANGTLAYVPADSLSAVAAESIEIEGAIRPVSPPAPAGVDRFAPDGLRIATLDTVRDLSLWVWWLDGRAAPFRIAIAGPELSEPVWTPDGTHITFRSTRDSNPAIYWQRADGTGAEERLLDGDGYPIAWSRDGSTLYYTSGQHLWGWRRGQAAQSLLSGITHMVSVSPDNLWAAFDVVHDQQAATYVESLVHPGARVPIPDDDAYAPLWAPDGKRLYYVTQGTNRLMAVDVRTTPAIAFGTPKVLAEDISHQTANPSRHYDISADGKHLLLQVPDRTNTAAQEIVVIENWFTELKQRVPTK